MLLGAVLSACTVYVGLKVGIAFGMSITAVLLGAGFWGGVRLLRIPAKPWGILENNINQTACSAGASVAAAGLVAPIPALAMLTGQVLSYPQLVIWLFSVMLVGIVVAIPLRRQMIEADKLPFASGVAAAAMLREMHTRGHEATKRTVILLVAVVAAAGIELLSSLRLILPYALPFSLKGIAARSLTMTLNPSLLLAGAGGLVGFRICCSLLIGAALAYGLLVPPLVRSDYVHVAVYTPMTSLPTQVSAAVESRRDLEFDKGRRLLRWTGTTSTDARADLSSLSDDPEYQAAIQDRSSQPAPDFRTMNIWLLWPGATLMVLASLTSLALSWRSIFAVLRRAKHPGDNRAREAPRVSPRWFIGGLIGVLLLSVALQWLFFGIRWHIAAIGVVLTFALAVVAARVSGETSLTPSGPMGKITQLLFGVISPAAPATNLMAANVTGGAASQCADLMHDFKCGHILGASPRRQTVAQVFGALAGALAGSAVYLALIPNPQEMLGSADWPAPAARLWLAVACIFADGLSALPPGTPIAMAIAALFGVTLPIAQHFGPSRAAKFIPSAASVGLAFVFPAYIAFLMFTGGVIALLVQTFAKSWSARFLISACAGLIVGESLTGLGMRFFEMLTA